MLDAIEDPQFGAARRVAEVQELLVRIIAMSTRLRCANQPPELGFLAQRAEDVEKTEREDVLGSCPPIVTGLACCGAAAVLIHDGAA